MCSCLSVEASRVSARFRNEGLAGKGPCRVNRIDLFISPVVLAWITTIEPPKYLCISIISHPIRFLSFPFNSILQTCPSQLFS